MSRIESLEHRTLLAASINIDALSALTYDTDSQAFEELSISVSGNVYTFTSSRIIDVASNSPGLVVTGDGTNTVTVAGITALEVVANADADVISLASTNTPTSIQLDARDAVVTLGDPLDPSGLSSLSAPVTLGATLPARTITLDDSGSSADATYTLTSSTLSASGGFGGLSYPSQVGVIGLILKGSNGTDVLDVESTSNEFTFQAGTGDNQVNVTNDGDLSGLAASVNVTSLGSASLYIEVDDSAGASPAQWYLSGGGLAMLAMLELDTQLRYDLEQTDGLTLRAPRGLANFLQVDFAIGPMTPASAGVSYDGGYDSASGASSNLTFINQLPSGVMESETHNVAGPGAGSVAFTPGSSTPALQIRYSGLSPHSIYDTVPAQTYTFNAPGGVAGTLAIRAGARTPATNNFQTLLISSPGSFTDTHVASKTNVNVSIGDGLNSTRSTVDYGIPTPAAGLNGLNLISGDGDDEARLVALPPGATFTLLQGPGSDQAYLSLPGTSAATATNLDGGPGVDSLAIDAGGLQLTAANFSSPFAGTVLVSGIAGAGPVAYTRYESVVVADAAAIVPEVVAIPIHGTVGQPLVNVTAGAFVGAAGTKASDYAATIDWGDGSTSAGVIVQDGANPLVFYVYGTHTYYDFRSFASMRSSLTVRSLGASSTRYVGGVPVTIVTPQGPPVSSSWQTFIDSAPIEVAVSDFSGFENIPIATAERIIVATFTDLGGLDPTDPFPAARYFATINWGDGSTTVSPLESLRNGTTNSFFVLAAPHTYATPGSYVVTVAVSDRNSGAQATGLATGVATIADAPLTQTPSQPTGADAREGIQFVDRVVGSFVDGNPRATTDQYTVSIDWGDGSPTTLGRVIQPGGAGTAFFVVGTHTYANALAPGAAPLTVGAGPVAPITLDGTYRLTMAVRDTFGSAVNLYNVLTVADRPLRVSGALDSASDTGISDADGVTNDSTPTFSGVASEGGAVVYVYASTIGGPPVLVGSATAGATGAWSFTPAEALADGGYQFRAQAYDASGHTVSELTDLTPSLVIDTVGPRATDLVFDNFRGQVIASFRDFGGVGDSGVGLAQASLRDANNFRFAKLAAANSAVRRFLATSISVSPGTDAGEQVATVRFNDGAGIRGGRYLFTARSVDPSNLSGIRDAAGNALDGEFYGYFPSGNDVNGGDFEARLDARHHTIFPPRTQVGAATPRTPAGRPATGRFLRLDGSLAPSASSAVRLASARGVPRMGRVGS